MASWGRGACRHGRRSRRAAAADAKAPGIGGDVRAFVAGDRHHLALAVPLDDHYMGGLVDKYFGRRPALAYWALRTDAD